MRKSVECRSWVVYRMMIPHKVTGTNAVCEQREWEAMELSHPGLHLLIQGGIPNEGEAEQLARTTPLAANASQLVDRKRPIVPSPATDAAKLQIIVD